MRGCARCRPPSWRATRRRGRLRQAGAGDDGVQTARRSPTGCRRTARARSEIGFAIPQTYNASRILFDNLGKGRGDRLALTGPLGTRSYAELCAEASRWGHGFISLGLKRGDRILMFLDDTPAYPAAFFGAVRAGFVPLLINTLTPPDLLQFYLSDSGAAVAVADAEFCRASTPTACKDTALQHADRGQRRRRRSRRAEYDRRRALAAGLCRRACGGRHRSQRDGVLDVFVGLDRPAQGHRPSAARHGL